MNKAERSETREAALNWMKQKSAMYKKGDV